MEDRDDATPADGAGEVAFFPGNSIWPAAMGLGAVSLAIGLAFGKWFWAIGGILLVGAIIGFAVEAEYALSGGGPGRVGPYVRVPI